MVLLSSSGLRPGLLLNILQMHRKGYHHKNFPAPNVSNLRNSDLKDLRQGHPVGLRDDDKDFGWSSRSRQFGFDELGINVLPAPI